MKALWVLAAVLGGLSALCFGDTAARVDPPQDQEKMYLSVVGDPGNGEYRQIKAWFYSDPDLAEMRRGVHYRVIDTGSAIFRERYADNVTGLPCVRLQTHTGAIVGEIAGTRIPKTPAALLDAMQAETGQLLPWRRRIERRECPDGECDPEPEIEYLEDVPPVDVVDVPVEPEGVPILVALVAIGIATAVSAGASLWLCVKKETGE